MLSSGRQTALLLALVGMLYYNALGNEFHYDDFHSIVHNPHIRHLGNLPQFFSDPGLFSAPPAVFLRVQLRAGRARSSRLSPRQWALARGQCHLGFAAGSGFGVR